MREVGSLIQETGSIRNPQIILMWDISYHLATIGVTSAIAKCAVARIAHRRSAIFSSKRALGTRLRMTKICHSCSREVRGRYEASSEAAGTSRSTEWKQFVSIQ
jgi:hypothetical protein